MLSMHFSITSLGLRLEVKTRTSILPVTTNNRWFSQSGKVVEKLQNQHKNAQCFTIWATFKWADGWIWSAVGSGRVLDARQVNDTAFRPLLIVFGKMFLKSRDELTDAPALVGEWTTRVPEIQCCWSADTWREKGSRKKSTTGWFSEPRPTTFTVS